MGDRLREWLMRRIMGPHAYWIADDAQRGLAELSEHSVLGGGAVIALAHVMDESGATRATYEVGRWRVTVEPTAPADLREQERDDG